MSQKFAFFALLGLIVLFGVAGCTIHIFSKLGL